MQACTRARWSEHAGRAADAIARPSRRAVVSSGRVVPPLLAPIYDAFTEGFETPDLIAAQRLLQRTAPLTGGYGRSRQPDPVHARGA